MSSAGSGRGTDEENLDENASEAGSVNNDASSEADSGEFIAREESDFGDGSSEANSDLDSRAGDFEEDASSEAGSDGEHEDDDAAQELQRKQLADSLGLNGKKSPDPDSSPAEAPVGLGRKVFNNIPLIGDCYNIAERMAEKIQVAGGQGKGDAALATAEVFADAFSFKPEDASIMDRDPKVLAALGIAATIKKVIALLLLPFAFLMSPKNKVEMKPQGDATKISGDENTDANAKMRITPKKGESTLDVEISEGKGNPPKPPTPGAPPPPPPPPVASEIAKLADAMAISRGMGGRAFSGELDQPLPSEMGKDTRMLGARPPAVAPRSTARSKVSPTSARPPVASPTRGAAGSAVPPPPITTSRTAVPVAPDKPPRPGASG